MSRPIADLTTLLRSLQPVLNPGLFAFCVLPLDADASAIPAVAAIREAEGLTLVVPEELAAALGLSVNFRAAWITLTVHSDLSAVGLTAAVASALAAEGIACNVIAGAYHDHLFVPVERGEDALEVLKRL